VHDDVGLRHAQGAGEVSADRKAKPRAEAADVADVASGLGGIRIHAADDPEPWFRCGQPHGGGADRTKTDVQDAYGAHGRREL
jgi:hypothetical protein